ncbi:TPA: hypothetical protein ACK0CK_002754 [Staphylococcus aureus]
MIFEMLKKKKVVSSIEYEGLTYRNMYDDLKDELELTEEEAVYRIYRDNKDVGDIVFWNNGTVTCMNHDTFEEHHVKSIKEVSSIL